MAYWLILYGTTPLINVVIHNRCPNFQVEIDVVFIMNFLCARLHMITPCVKVIAFASVGIS